ncbi:MAG: DUF488 family protein [Paramuribaculum sp.]|nr:DUF488 family protein [Paramuribaculum sp.]
MAQTISLKRAYDPMDAGDGFRVYVDRLWPRGLSHETFHYDLWDKDIAPSAELREWFHHHPDANWDEFEQRYKKELINSPALTAFKAIVDNKPKVTLLYSSHDTVHNNAQVLRDLL